MRPDLHHLSILAQQDSTASRSLSPTPLRRRGAIHRSPPGADDGSQRLLPADSSSPPPRASPALAVAPPLFSTFDAHLPSLGDAAEGPAAGPRIHIAPLSTTPRPARRSLESPSPPFSPPPSLRARPVVELVVPPFWWDEKRQALQSLTAPDPGAKGGTAAHEAGDKGVWVVYCGPPPPPFAVQTRTSSDPHPLGPPIVPSSSCSSTDARPSAAADGPLADPGCGAILSTSAAFFPPPPPDFSAFRSSRPTPAALGRTAARAIPTGGFVSLEARGAGESTFDGLLDRLRPAAGGREAGPRPAIVACRNWCVSSFAASP